MKKELIAAVIGAGIVGILWTGSVYATRNRTSIPSAPEASAPEASAPEESAPEQHPGKRKKPVTDVYSALPEKNFPGLKLLSTDFLAPLNRLIVTEHVLIDDPNGFYGSGGAPMYAILFGIREEDSTHFFLTSGLQDHEICDLVYLGKDIELEKIEPAGNGYWMATYKDKEGKAGRGFVAISAIVGSDPVEDTGIAQPIELDPVAKYAEECDPFVWEINAEEFWSIYRNAIRENDKMTVAKMHSFPIGGRFGTIYTRAEFVERYDELYDAETREWILNGCDSNSIWYSWRGAQLPNGEWLRSAFGPDEPAGPLED